MTKGERDEKMKYKTLKENLINLINKGEGCDAAGRFISERKISEMFEVSRTTVRRAIADLQKEGYLLSMHGKGTFVKGRNRTQSIYSVIRCTQNYAEMGLHPSMEVLKKEVVPATENVAANLKIKVGAPVLLLEKLFKGDRTIFNDTVSFMSLERFPGLERANFSSVPILEIMRALYAVQPKRTENTVEAILPPEEIAKNLKITLNTPLLLFESVTYGSYKGEYVPLEYFKCYYKTDLLRFSFTQEHVAAY